MKFTTATAALLALATSALASPTTMKMQKRCITANTQSCTATDHAKFFASYSVEIGITYAGGSGCDDVLNALRAKDLDPTNWQCVDDGCGFTQLFFNASENRGTDISEVLEDEYPTIAGGFNCPDY